MCVHAQLLKYLVKFSSELQQTSQHFTSSVPMCAVWYNFVPEFYQIVFIIGSFVIDYFLTACTSFLVLDMIEYAIGCFMTAFKVSLSVSRACYSVELVVLPII